MILTRTSGACNAVDRDARCIFLIKAHVGRSKKHALCQISNKYFILGLKNGFLNVILLLRGYLVGVNSLPKLRIARCPSGIGFFVPRARIIKIAERVYNGSHIGKSN